MNYNLDMDKLESIETLEALDHAVEAGDMTEREIQTAILKAWSKMPPHQTRQVIDSMSKIKRSAVNFADRGGMELAAKLGMFLKSKGL